jgi:hypothetical protein
VGDDLGVGLAGEGEAVALELGAEGGVVLDDAVVDDRDRGAAAAEVGMGVAVGRRPVGGPPGVADAAGAAGRLEPSTMATPALSYPRYSSRRRPATRMGAAAWTPV